MHDGMQYDLIQGQGHEPLKVRNPAVFKSYLLHHLQWQLATDHWDDWSRKVAGHAIFSLH